MNTTRTSPVEQTGKCPYGQMSVPLTYVILLGNMTGVYRLLYLFSAKFEIDSLALQFR